MLAIKASGVFLMIAWFSQQDAFANTNEPTFTVSAIEVDKTSLTGIGSIKLDYTITTTNFSGTTLGKMGIAYLLTLSGNERPEWNDSEDEVSCYNTPPKLVSGDVVSGRYTQTFNFCNQYASGEYVFGFIGDKNVSQTPIITYINNAPPPPPNIVSYQINAPNLSKSSLIPTGLLDFSFSVATNDSKPQPIYCYIDGYINPFEATLISGTINEGRFRCLATIPKQPFEIFSKGEYALNILIVYFDDFGKQELRQVFGYIVFADPYNIPKVPPTLSQTPTLTAADLACREKLAAITGNIKLVEKNLLTWRSLWNNYDELAAFMKAKGMTLSDTYNYYITLIGEQRALEDNYSRSILDLKNECSLTSIYSEWGAAYDYSYKIHDLVLETQDFISYRYTASELKAKQEAEAKAEVELKARQEAEAKAAAERVVCDANRVQLLSVQNSLLTAIKSYPKSASTLNDTRSRLQTALTSSCIADVTLNDFRGEVLSVISQAKTSASTNKTTIICVKGKSTKKVTAVKPKCPKGYKKR